MLFSNEKLREMYLLRFEGNVEFVESLNGFRVGETVSFDYKGVSATSGNIRLLMLQKQKGHPPTEMLAVIGISDGRHILIPSTAITSERSTNTRVTEDRADETGKS